MNQSETQEFMLRTASDLAELRQLVVALVKKDQRADQALSLLRNRLTSCLSSFHRDKYKSTDQRLALRALAEEIRIFDKLGFDLGVAGSAFLLGVAALLDGRNQSALYHFAEFIANANANCQRRRENG